MKGKLVIENGAGERGGEMTARAVSRVARAASVSGREGGGEGANKGAAGKGAAADRRRREWTAGAKSGTAGADSRVAVVKERGQRWECGGGARECAEATAQAAAKAGSTVSTGEEGCGEQTVQMALRLQVVRCADSAESVQIASKSAGRVEQDPGTRKRSIGTRNDQCTRGTRA